MAYEGWGASATGGAGGTTLVVSSTADSGAGTLRAALTASGTRTIVFTTSGMITLVSPIIVTNPNFTILGETSPLGISLQNPLAYVPGQAAVFRCLDIQTSNFIISHLGLRPGYHPFDPAETFPQHSYGIILNGASNGVVDHCSISRAITRMVSMDSCTDITLSWNIISNGLAAQQSRTGDPFGGKGFSIHNGSSRISMHHNVFGHCDQRMPQASGDFDCRHNTIFDWLDHGADCFNTNGNTRINFIGNTIVPLRNAVRGLVSNDWRGHPTFPAAGTLQVYFDNPSQLNLGKVSKWNGVNFDQITWSGSEYQAVSPFSFPAVSPVSGPAIYSTVGRFPRDAEDASLLAELGYVAPAVKTKTRRRPIRAYGASD